MIKEFQIKVLNKMKMTKLKINKPDKKDIPALINLWQKQYQFHNDIDPVYYVPNSSNQDRVFEKYIKNAILNDSPSILVARDNNKIIGFITFDMEENNYIDTNIKKFGEIIEIFVEKEYRKKSVGTKLIQEAENFFNNKGIKYIKISSSSFNDKASEFYNKIGYINHQTLFFKCTKK